MLSVSQATFRPDFSCDVQPPRFDPATGSQGRSFPLWCDELGREVWGAKAFLNTENYQLSIIPDIDTGTSALYVQFSGAAFAESNFVPLDRDGCGEVSLKVQRDLEHRGLSVRLDAGKLTRLDVALNVPLSESVANFAPVFSGAGLGRRVSKTDFGGTGFIVGNPKRDRWQLALYDKGAEMKAKAHGVAPFPKNTLRAELRLLRGEVIRTRLGIESATLSEVRANWEAVRAAHRETLLKHFFNRMPNENPALHLDGRALLRIGAGSKQPRSKSGAFALWSVLLGQYGLDGARAVIREEWSHLTRQALATQLAELESAAAALALAGDSVSGRALWELYVELREKLLCDA